MKLRVRFLQLPILFDAERLAAEVSAIPESAWRPHPKKFAGNDALPLITTDGDPDSDARAGAMAPTPHLLACPYLMQVLERLGATWGRSRLMRLSGDAEVNAHVDTDYYWRDHMRVHVPIVTQPTVRFFCGEEVVNMAAGECWIFDTWSLHRVHNDATQARIHLVADTVGGAGFRTLMEGAQSPTQLKPGWSAALSPPRDGPPAKLAYESRNVPQVMTPWELRDHLGFLIAEVPPGDPRIPAIAHHLNRMQMAWHGLWARSGDDAAARPEYAALLTECWSRIDALGVREVALRNRMSLGHCLNALVFSSALGGGETMDGDQRNAPVPLKSQAPARPSTAAPRPGRDPVFDRPIFIVSSPRSGSTLLFETLAKAANLFTIGGEAHRLMESIPALTPAAHDWASNRITPDDVPPETATQLRESFLAALKDRDGRPPGTLPLRMLEKTPKNALRIPFLVSAFPEARFIYLYRDPRATMASMIEAWRSGKFRMYRLPGWTGPAWSLLLTPGWRSLIGAPLNQIVASQWAATTRTLLDDLEALPADRWTAIDYADFIASPQAAVQRLCEAMQIGWDGVLGPDLPISRHTLTPPNPDKWQAHAEAVEAALPLVAAEDARARAVLARAAAPQPFATAAPAHQDSETA